MNKRPMTLEHGMLLDAKTVMDDAWCVLQDLQKLVPEALHEQLATLILRFESELAQCDVAERYEEKT